MRKGYDIPMPKEQMSVKRVGIGTDTDVFAAKENYVGATLAGLGGSSDDWWAYEGRIPANVKRRWEDHCDRTYSSDAAMVKRCRRNPGTPTWAPWTEVGKAERGLPVDWSNVAKGAVTFIIPGGGKPTPKTPVQQAYDQTIDWAKNLDQRTLQQTGMSASTLALGALVLGAVGVYAYRQSKGA